MHWKKGHKKACTTDDPEEACGVLFPEFELEIDAENFSPEKPEKEEKDPMAEYREYLTTAEASTESLGTEFSKDELEEMATQETEDDKQFRKFKKRISHAPDQVIRHSRHQEPLWVSHVHKASAEDIPNCTCGAPREFEFQVMPQLLNHLQVDSTTEASLDWGTVCVYTCRDSCSIGNKYSPEFVWKQDFPASATE
nr:hypothetical protein BaRGS_032618 [Batillaria attramentaria]